MLIATFGPTTGWVGKTITREGNVFILQDHGPITAADVMSYDSQGQLVWASDGTRAWVATQASGRTLSKGDLGTGLLWWAALAPIWVGLLQAASPALAVFLLLPFALLMMDRENVKRAGVDISGTLPWVFIFPPVYLYMRYKRAGQSFAAFIVSCPLFFLSYVITLTALYRLLFEY